MLTFARSRSRSLSLSLSLSLSFPLPQPATAALPATLQSATTALPAIPQPAGPPVIPKPVSPSTEKSASSAPSMGGTAPPPADLPEPDASGTPPAPQRAGRTPTPSPPPAPVAPAVGADVSFRRAQEIIHDAQYGAAEQDMTSSSHAVFPTVRPEAYRLLEVFVSEAGIAIASATAR